MGNKIYNGRFKQQTKGENVLNQAFIYEGTMFPRYISRIQRLKTLIRIFLAYLSLLFLLRLSLFNFQNPPLLLSLPPFIVISPFLFLFLFQLSSPQLDFWGILVLSSFCFATSWSWKKTFGGASTIQASHLTLNVADIRWGTSLMRMWLLHWVLHLLYRIP